MSRLILDLDDELRASLEQLATDDGRSVESLVLDMLSTYVEQGMRLRQIRQEMADRRSAPRGRLLDLVPDVPPMKGDELPAGWHDRETR